MYKIMMRYSHLFVVSQAKPCSSHDYGIRKHQRPSLLRHSAERSEENEPASFMQEFVFD
jgi:hypothetical protein